MRFVFPALALSIVTLSIYVDRAQPSVTATVCELGLCRFDQIYASVDREGATRANLAELIRQDPSNPSAWCTYAEALASHGDTAGAQAAFDRAVSLGPGMAPVLMRVANFEFTHGRTEDAFTLSQRILHQTGAFDQAIFSYLGRTQLSPTAFAERVLPLEARATSSWLKWLEDNGQGPEVVESARWMRTHGLETQPLALDATWALWRQEKYGFAQQLWSDWLDSSGAVREEPFNPDFHAEPDGSPFDWSLTGTSSVELKRENGLEVEFGENDRTTFSGVHQFLPLAPGRYRLSAEVEAHELAGQRVVFHILDVDAPRRIDIQTKPLDSNAPRGWVNLDFEIPAGTGAVELELVRYPGPADSDPKAGVLHVYRVRIARQG